MSTEVRFQISSSKPEDTVNFGEQLGRKCKGGEVFLLTSDLGGGKTTFTKGLAKGLGSPAVVSSPTFTISQVYECRDGLEIHHFDFYRLHEGGMVALELADVIDNPKAVIVIEWGDVIDDVLPEIKAEVNISKVAEDEDGRVLSVKLPAQLEYLRSGN